MDDVTFFWGGWEPLVRIVLVATLGYVWLLVLVRSTGQRTLAKMTPLDFIISITLGSAFGRVITARDVAVSEVGVAFVVLVVLQWAAAYVRGRSRWITRLIDVEPALLYHRGQILHGAMRRHRITEKDLLGAARQNGMGALAEAEVILLEPGGEFAVIGPDQLGDSSAIPDPPPG
ncbi:hypothetical protein BH23ACT2_BH23ACT2_05350 [soil metagenome]